MVATTRNESKLRDRFKPKGEIRKSIHKGVVCAFRNNPPSDLGFIDYPENTAEHFIQNLETGDSMNCKHVDFIAHQVCFFRPESNKMAVEFMDYPNGDYKETPDGKADIFSPLRLDSLAIETTDLWIAFKNVESFDKEKGMRSGKVAYGVVIHFSEFNAEWIYKNMILDDPTVIYIEGAFRNKDDALKWITNCY